MRERVSVGDGELSEVWEGDRRNIGRACRLQLYCYPKHRRRRASSSISEVFFHSNFKHIIYAYFCST